MAYIVPNAADTGSTQRYSSINQAEPDALDIEALGLRSNWIRSGGVATVTGASVVSISAGVAVINNVPYTFSESTLFINADANARFVVAVARLSGSTVSVTAVYGAPSPTNPMLPRSRSLLASNVDFNASNHVDPATDALICAIFRTQEDLTAGHVVDKRILNPVAVTRLSTAGSPPTSTSVDVVGDVVIHNGSPYIKVDSTTWKQVATTTELDGAGFPVGSIFAWPSTVNPTGSSTVVTATDRYIECTGQAVSRTDFPALFAVVGTTYGAGNGVSTFNVPNLTEGRVPVGTTVGSGLVGTSSGTGTVTLTTANLPAHNHSVSVQTHGALNHTTNGSTVTAQQESQNGHVHRMGKHGHQGALMFLQHNTHNGYHVHDIDSHSGDYAFHVDVYRVNEGDITAPYNLGTTQGSSDQLTEIAGAHPRNTAAKFEDSSIVGNDGVTPINTGTGAHTHSVPVDTHPSLPHTVTEATVGSASPVNITPKGYYMRWYIRAR